MSLLSGDIIVEEDSEECLSSLAHPARETSAKAARHEKIKVEGRMEVFVIFINVTIRQKLIPPMGCRPHDIGVDSRCKHQAVKTDSKKRSLRVCNFIASNHNPPRINSTNNRRP